MVAGAWDLALDRPGTDRVWSRRGTAGVVVVGHGPVWTLVARSGGPILLLAEGYPDPLRLEQDDSWSMELDGAVRALIAMSEGRDPQAGLADVPPPPRMPWHPAP